MYKNDRITRRYSEPFKLKILSELSTEKYTKYELVKVYGIASTTFDKWIRKYKCKDLIDTAHAERATKNAIKLYYEIRLHLSLDFKTPNMQY